MPAELKAYPFDFKKRHSRRRSEAAREKHTVAIVGGGVAGLTAALALAAQGIQCVVIEADDTVCFGSRALCISRRSLEIFERLGASEQILAKGLAWAGGKSFYRNKEVLRFTMPDDDDQKLPPMINIQQYYLEEYLVDALGGRAETTDIRWSSKVAAIRDMGDSILLDVHSGDDRYQIEADWVIACDGGRSTVREALGLHLQGTAYEGLYIIADIELQSDLPVERLAWFDPPSNRGSTILMHKQPDNIWRIDYQLRDDEDPEVAVLPQNVLPRVQAHLEMIGETGAWSPLWISIYKANALTLDSYRHGRIFFAGDAAHLVPIFGVRGANSSIDDVDNLAWKLAYVIQGRAGQALLDSYSAERVFAARENLRSGTKSTEFMAPPTFAFKLMREAVLDLAVDTPVIRSLINPRQTTAICYTESPLNAAQSQDGLFDLGPCRGSVLQSVPVLHVRADRSRSAAYLTEMVQGGDFLILQFSGTPAVAADLRSAMETIRQSGAAVRFLAICSHEAPGFDGEYLLDPQGRAAALYGAQTGAVYLVRPDGHIAGRWRAVSGATLIQSFSAVLGAMPKMEHA